MKSIFLPTILVNKGILKKGPLNIVRWHDLKGFRYRGGLNDSEFKQLGKIVSSSNDIFIQSQSLNYFLTYSQVCKCEHSYENSQLKAQQKKCTT